MSQFDNAGFDDLRNYIENNWNWLSLRDSSGSEVTRIDVNSDGRVSWSGSNSNPMTLSGTFTGGDGDIAQATTYTEARLYKTSGSSTSMASESFTDATIEASVDELTISIDVEIPNL